MYDGVKCKSYRGIDSCVPVRRCYSRVNYYSSFTGGCRASSSLYYAYERSNGASIDLALGFRRGELSQTGVVNFPNG